LRRSHGETTGLAGEREVWEKVLMAVKIRNKIVGANV